VTIAKKQLMDIKELFKKITALLSFVEIAATNKMKIEANCKSFNKTTSNNRNSKVYLNWTQVIHPNLIQVIHQNCTHVIHNQTIPKTSYHQIANKSSQTQ